MAFFGVNSILQKFCQCKKNDKYQVWYLTLPLEIRYFTWHEVGSIHHEFIWQKSATTHPQTHPHFFLGRKRGGGILTRPGAMRQGRWVWAVMGISHPWTLVDPLVQHRSHSEHLPGAAFDPPSITTLPSFGGKFLMQKRDGGNRFVPWKSIWSGWGEQCWWWLVGEAPGCFRGDDDKETASKTMVAKWNLIWIVLNRWLRCELCLDWIKLSWSIF